MSQNKFGCNQIFDRKKSKSRKDGISSLVSHLFQQIFESRDTKLLHFNAKSVKKKIKKIEFLKNFLGNKIFQRK